MFLVIRDCEHYAADCIFTNEGAKDRAKVGEAVFMDSWLVVFRGCFGILFRRRGEIDTPVTSVRWSSMVPRKKIARKLGRLFLQILGSVFLGDVWNILCGHPKNIIQ